MAKSIKFKLNLPGLNQVMKSPAMQAVLSAKGQEVAARANGMASDPKAEYSTDTKTINWIAVTTVRASNGEAVHENYENNTLLKSLH